MKIASCAVIALCTSALPLLAAPDTAYKALRIVGTQRGNDSLQHVIEVDGLGGVPTPMSWRVVLDDPTARGGVRQLDVSNGAIVSEHTPVNAYTGTTAGALIDFHKLNLDSPGAFTIAEKAAEKAKIGFDSVDYTLRTGDGPGGGPVWVVHMMDTGGKSVGTLSVAADTGAIVGSDLPGSQVPNAYAGPQAPPPPPPLNSSSDYTDHDNLYTPPTTQPAVEPIAPPDQDDQTDGDDSQGGLRIGHRIKHVILSAGESLKNFITGNSSSPSDH